MICFFGCFWFNFWLSFSFTHSLTPLVAFFGMGKFGVWCSVQKILWRRKIIVVKADFTEGWEDLRISAFGVCCPVANKVFRYPWRLILLLLARSIMPSVLALSVGSLGRPPLLPLEQSIIPATITIGVDMVRKIIMVVRWMFGGVRWNATSKGAELSYKLGYLIIIALFLLVRSDRTYC